MVPHEMRIRLPLILFKALTGPTFLSIDRDNLQISALVSRGEVFLSG